MGFVYSHPLLIAAIVAGVSYAIAGLAIWGSR